MKGADRIATDPTDVPAGGRGGSSRATPAEQQRVRVHAFGDDALGRDDATAVAQRIAAGEISIAEAVSAAVDRARRMQSIVNGIEVSDFRRALAGVGGEPAGAFRGVPTFVKDNVDVAGLPTNFGSAAFVADPAPADGDFLGQFRAQGFTVLGKSRLPEFGFNASTEYMDADPVRNPWHTAYSSGASSGGSAALVASGAVPIAHANDGGGSIRIPAAACGLVGMKTTRGRLVMDVADRQAPVRTVVQGVITRTVRDTARFLAAAEAYYRNPALAPVRWVAGPAPTRLRIGVVTDSVSGQPTDGETRAGLWATADLLAGLGHDVQEIPNPVDRRFVEDFPVFWGFLAFLVSTAGPRAFGRGFDAARTDNLTRGLSAMYRHRMHRTPGVLYRLRRMHRSYARVFARLDVVLSPVLSHVTPRIGHLSPALDFDELFTRLAEYVGFTPWNNIAGGPAIALPTGLNSEGLPLAAHFSAAHGDERTLLELAYELEQARPFPVIW